MRDVVEQVDLLLPINHIPCDAVHAWSWMLLIPTSVLCFPFYSWLKFTVIIMSGNLLYTVFTSLAFIIYFNIASCKSLERKAFAAAILKFLKCLSLPFLPVQTKMIKENPFNSPDHRWVRKRKWHYQYPTLVTFVSTNVTRGRFGGKRVWRLL